MPITTFPDRNVIPRVPKIFVYYNASTTSGTYYTTVNSTGVRGRLTKITMSGVPAQYHTIRVTIDGVQSSLSPNPSGTNGVVGLGHNNNASSLYEAGSSFDYYCDISFTNSILVEFMQNQASAQPIIGNVMYSQESA